MSEAMAVLLGLVMDGAKVQFDSVDGRLRIIVYGKDGVIAQALDKDANGHILRETAFTEILRDLERHNHVKVSKEG
jgi:hypothetical protein